MDAPQQAGVTKLVFLLAAGTGAPRGTGKSVQVDGTRAGGEPVVPPSGGGGPGQDGGGAKAFPRPPRVLLA